MFKNSEILNNIEWDVISSRLRTLTHFSRNDNHFSHPLSYDQCDEFFSLTAFFISDSALHNDLAQKLNIHVHDVIEGEKSFDFLDLITKGHYGDFKDLNFVCSGLESYHHLKKLTPENQSTSLNCFDQQLSQKLFSHFVKPFRKFVSPKGEVDFSSHPTISKLLQRQFDLERSIRSTLDFIQSHERYKNLIQFEGINIINDNYVIAIKTDSYSSALGPILSRSGRGHTLFVEPFEIRKLNNQRLETLALIEEEKEKIIRVYCNILAEFGSYLHGIFKELLFFDALNVRINLAKEWNLARPVFVTDSLSIKGLFHPLVENCIANDIFVDSDKKGLVISGPNTGGKTATLKSAALTFLFSRLGLFVPAVSAKIPFAHSIYYFAHDNQDLSQGLSSFAAESAHYLNMLEDLDENAVIFIDEIFNSTSSEEASALAVGLIDQIATIDKTYTFLSTHHQLLKIHLQKDKRFLSGHMELDTHLNRPTYKLVIGEPGSSYAIRIFGNLGNKFKRSQAIVSKAVSIIDKKAITYEGLLEELSKSRSELTKLVRENRDLNTILKNKEKSIQGVLILEKDKALSVYKDKLNSILEKGRGLIDEIQKGNVSSTKTFEKMKSILIRELNPERELARPQYAGQSHSTIEFEDVKVGEIYNSLLLGTNCTVIEKDTRQKRLKISKAGKSIWVRGADVTLSISGKRPGRRHVSVFVEQNITGRTQIDARGMRLEQFQREVESQLLELLNGEIPFLTIIHGHGTGVLKNWLRAYLRQKTDLQFSADEGNDGSTQVKLKGDY